MMKPNTETDQRSHSKKLRSLRAALFGNILEFFDWTIFALFAPYIAAAVFEKGDPTSAVLQTLAIFAVSFVARPLGGLIFGRIADRRGRRASLALAMTLMGVGSLLIASVPTYEIVGVLAPVILLVARLVQGLAHGGESAAAYVYVSELAPPAKRGLWSSSIFFSASIGTIAGTLSGALMTNFLPEEAMQAWGWRVPFLVGVGLSFYALYLRIKSVETEIGAAIVEKAKAPTKTLSETNTRATVKILLKLLVIVGAANVAFYTWISFASSYAITSLGMDASAAFVSSLAAQVLALGLFPAFGYLSDRIGRKPVALVSLVGFGALSFPFSWILSSAPLSLFVVQAMAFALWAAIASILPTLLSESLTSMNRAVGIGLVGSLAAALFGGTAPLLNSWLTSIELAWVFTTYLTVVMFIAAAVVATLRETKGIDLRTMARAGTPTEESRENSATASH